MDIPSTLALEISSTSDVIEFIGEKLDDLELPMSDRTTISMSCFHIVFENQKAVNLLISNGFYGASAALIRPMYEACVQGNWFLFCAIDSQINKFKERDKINKTLKEQVTQLERLPAFSNGFLSTVYEGAYRVMHSLTHPGMQQIRRRFDGSNIELKFEEDEIIDILVASNRISLFVSYFMAAAIEDETLVMEIAKFTDEYISKNL